MTPPTTLKLVSKQVPVPTEPIEPTELIAFSQILEFEGKFSPGF